MASCSSYITRPSLFAKAYLRKLPHKTHTSRLQSTRTMDYKSIKTPESCYVDFCLIPVSLKELNLPVLGLFLTAIRWAPAPSPLPPRSPRYRSCSRPAGLSTRCTRPAPPSVSIPPPLLYSWIILGIDKVSEGAWDDVMAVVGKAHSVVHNNGAVRVQTSMRAGTRTDKGQTAEEKVKKVQDILGNGE